MLPATAAFARQPLHQAATTLVIETSGRGLRETTPEVTAWVAASGLTEGLLKLFVRHRPASLLIPEGADPDVRGDLERFFTRLAIP